MTTRERLNRIVDGFEEVLTLIAPILPPEDLDENSQMLREMGEVRAHLTTLTDEQIEKQGVNALNGII